MTPTMMKSPFTDGIILTSRSLQSPSERIPFSKMPISESVAKIRQSMLTQTTQDIAGPEEEDTTKPVYFSNQNLNTVAPCYCKLKEIFSSPPYFDHLSRETAKPFKLKCELPQYKILTGSLFSQKEMGTLAELAYDGKKEVQQFIEAQLYSVNAIKREELYNRPLLLALMMEAYKFGCEQNFSNLKLSTTMEIFLTTHQYFGTHYWLSPQDIWDYLKEVVYRHSVENSPTAKEVFYPDECYIILKHFHKVYLEYLPLIHILVFKSFKLMLCWPFDP